MLGERGIRFKMQGFVAVQLLDLHLRLIDRVHIHVRSAAMSLMFSAGKAEAGKFGFAIPWFSGKHVHALTFGSYRHPLSCGHPVY